MENIKEIQEISYKYFKAVVKADWKANKTTSSLFKDKSFIFEDISNWNLKDLKETIEVISSYFVGQELSATFFDSWNTMIEAENSGERIIHQLLHYFTTYGKRYIEELTWEELKEIETYFPNKDLFKQELSKIAIIKVISFDEFKSKLKELVSQNLALDNQEDIDAIALLVAKLLKDKIKLSDIKNKEIKNILISKYGFTSEDVMDILKQVFNILTNSSLYIKSKQILRNIENISSYYQDSERKDAEKILVNFFNNKNSIKELSKVFFREQDFILTLKSIFRENDTIRKAINKARKLADKNKKKINNDYQKITSKEVSLVDSIKIIGNLDLTYLIKLGNAINYRINWLEKYGEDKPIVFAYMVRNNKLFVKKADAKNTKSLTELKLLKEEVIKLISKKVQKNIDNNNIVRIRNKDVSLSLPVSEKQFVWDFPFWSKININRDWNKDLLIWISWFNVEENWMNYTIDLDLHVSNKDKHFGWNSNWGDDDSWVLFSWDVTDAPRPRGATEVYKITNKKEDYYIATINDYIHNSDIKKNVEFKFFIGQRNQYEHMEKNPMIKQEEIIYQTKLKLEAVGNSLWIINTKGIFIFGKYKVLTNVTGLTKEDMFNSFTMLMETKLTFDDLDIKFKENNISEATNILEKVIEDTKWLIEDDKLNKLKEIKKEIEDKGKEELKDSIILDENNVTKDVLFKLVSNN